MKEVNQDGLEKTNIEIMHYLPPVQTCPFPSEEQPARPKPRLILNFENGTLCQLKLSCNSKYF